MLPNSFLLPLAISLAVVSIAGYFFLQRMNEQNHKISSMLGLVTTMAEDLNGMRAYIHASGMTGGVGTTNPIVMQSKEDSQDQNSLIDVSDEDSDDEDSDDEDSDDEDSDDEDSDDESGVEDVNCTSQVNIIDLNDVGNVKVINMDNNVDNNVDNNIIPVKINGVFSADLTDSCNEEEDDDDDDDDDVDDDDVDDDDVDDDVPVVSMASLNDITLNPIQKTDLLMSVGPIIDLEQSSNDIEVVNYKKIAIGKLRGIVQEKGIVADASKMKKVEILKALGLE